MRVCVEDRTYVYAYTFDVCVCVCVYACVCVVSRESHLSVCVHLG